MFKFIRNTAIDVGEFFVQAWDEAKYEIVENCDWVFPVIACVLCGTFIFYVIRMAL